MSGRKQHFIPQFILRGFSEEKKKGRYSLKAYFSDRSFPTSPEGIAAQRDFYSKGDEDVETLDDKITSAETEYARLYQRLTTEHPDPPQVARLLSHLLARAAHIRGSLAHMTGRFMTFLADAHSDPVVFRRSMGMEGSKPSGFLKEALDKKYNELRARAGKAFMSRYDFQMQAYRLAQQRFGELFSGVQAEMRSFARFISAASPELVQEAHQKVLSDDIEPEARTKLLEKLNWSAIDISEPNLILSDAVAYGHTATGAVLPAFFLPADSAYELYFPITAQRILVGSSSQAQDFDLPNVNKMAAKSSWDFFLAHPKFEGSDLQKNIGACVDEFFGDLIAEKFSELMA